MFGHGAFDISHSFRNEGSESLPDKNDVYENWRRCYGVNPTLHRCRKRFMG